MEQGKNDLGRRIQVLRESNMMTRGDMAQYIGVTRKEVVDWEEGRVLPTAQQIVEIAAHFDTDPRALANVQDAEEPQETTAKKPIKGSRRLLTGVVCLFLGLCAAWGAILLMQNLSVQQENVEVEEPYIAPLPDYLALTELPLAQWDLDGDGKKEWVNTDGAEILLIQNGTAYALKEPLSDGQTLTAQDGVFILQNQQGESRIYSKLRNGKLYPAG